MKICFFSKYPPIEGGVASRTYWLAQALGKKGIEIHIITNALEVEECWREKIDWENPEDALAYQPNNVFVHSLNQRQKMHYIPYAPAYLERMTNNAMEVMKKHKCDLIDSWYILPYGLAAFLTKLLTDKPFILRHAGSDITRLYRNEDLKNIFSAAIENADRFITNIRPGAPEEAFRNFYQLEPSAPDPAFFNPDVAPANLTKLKLDVSKKTPLLTYIGKYNPKSKGLYELADSLNKIKDDFFLLLVSGGDKIEEFNTYLKGLKGLEGKHKILGFVPPWQIPGIIKSSTCILQLETDFPVKIHWPVQPQEAMACGKPCLISEDLYEKFKDRFPLKAGKNILIASPKDPVKLKNTLEFIIKNQEKTRKIGRAAYEIFNWQDRFEKYIASNIELYEKTTLKTGDAYLDKALEIYDKLTRKLSGILKFNGFRSSDKNGI